MYVNGLFSQTLYIEYKHDRVIADADEECSSESNCLMEYITRHAQINETSQN